MAADDSTPSNSGSKPPILCGSPVALIAKADSQTSLSLTNHTHTPPTDAIRPHSDSSAQALLRDVQHNSLLSERAAAPKRGVFQLKSRGSGSAGGGAHSKMSSSVHGKHYAKMGLVMDSPTKQATPTSSRISSQSVDIMGGGVACEGFEVVQLESGGGGGEDSAQASPPISVKNEPLKTEGEGPTSSPDSGYGNTPDTPAGDDHLNRATPSTLEGGRARSGAINGSKRLREDTQEGIFGMDPPSTPSYSSTHLGSNLTHYVPVVKGTEILNRTTPISSSMEGGGGEGSVLVSTSTSSASGSREMEHDYQSLPAQPFSEQPHSVSVDSKLHSRSHSVHNKKWRNRTISGKLHLSKSTEVLRPSKSFSAHNLLQDTKDYFQVTDELAQENSHLRLSEALLAVIEQYKATCLEQRVYEEQLVLSSSLPLLGSSPLSTPPPPPQFSSSPSTPGELSSWSSMSSIATTTDELVDGRVPRSMTRVSLLELMQSRSCDRSAESTAQKLLQFMAGHMSNNQKKDMSQLSIKLPTDFLLSLQTDEDLQKSVTTSSAHMRGNREWAPPRKQIIYHIKQPNKNLQAELAAQGYRCTGCGMKVEPSHAKHFRFCNYVGKYFCQNCHTNAIHIIPAHVLERWSFKKLPVSNFARDLLSKVHDEPVFSVNPAQHPIYKRVAVMGQAKEMRAQLVAIRQYLRTCRRASKLNQTVESLSPWTTDLSSFSMNDFLELKAGLKVRQLRAVLLEAISHVKSCPVCQGKGFVCEFCNSDDVIFPFEANKVSTCRDCRCCFHKECFAGSAKCPRCERIKERQKQRVRKIFMETEEEEFGEELTFVDPPG